MRTYWECVREALDKSERASSEGNSDDALKYAKEAAIASINLLEWAASKTEEGK